MASRVSSNLNGVCYEQIKDNYWYGRLGNFKLVIDRERGYYNATKLCKDGRKVFGIWKRNKDFKELSEYYNDERNFNGQCYYLLKIAGTEQNNLISGTYVREEVILIIANWISTEFYDKCYKIINDYFIERI